MTDSGFYVTLLVLLMAVSVFYIVTSYKKVQKKQETMLKQQKMLAQTMALKRANKAQQQDSTQTKVQSTL